MTNLFCFRSVVYVLASLGVVVVARSSYGTESCRSNATHMSWTLANIRHSGSILSVADERDMLPVAPCRWQTKHEATNELYQYLRHHVMDFDLPFLETMGFHEEGDLPDGLDVGMIGVTIDYALRAKVEFEYTDQLPLEIFQEFVLNYANGNEARSNWRPLLWQKLRFLIQPTTDSIADVVHNLNAKMWSLLAPPDQKVIYFKAQSTPLIFDTMSILAFGYASCTGTSILFVNALRTMGVPARLVGTAAWNQQREKGNHNWVEVWDNGEWYFLEPSLSTDPQKPADSVDDLERDPCSRWFCEQSRFTGHPSNTTYVYAARLESIHHSTFFPLAWEWTNQAVPGEDVSQFYLDRCGQCT